jgi:threonine synthase
MKWHSTRGVAPPVSFAEALFAGLAPDGGLYMPERLPSLPPDTWRGLVGAPVAEVAATLLAPLVGDEVPRGELEALLAEALDFPLPVVALAGGEGAADTHVLELFHGPTLAFKDVGARSMARLMAWFRARGRGPRHPGGGSAAAARGPLTVLVATSGDTGSAVAHAFFGVPDTEVVVLYPHGQVSPLQERQFATLGGNVRALAVEGSFDTCQRLVKEAFLDPVLRAGRVLTSANSINVGRLLPQAVYYATAGLALAGEALADPPWVVVPSGNFGNLAAGFLAQRMGAPLAAFVAATNANAVVPEFLAGAPYRPRPSVATLSNAMDVGSPSNWERIVALLGGEAAVRRVLVGHSVDDRATRAAIREVDQRFGYLMDPHTAVAWVAAERERGRREVGAPAAAGVSPASEQAVAGPSGAGVVAGHSSVRPRQRPPRRGPALLLATAHPAKFPETVEPTIGRPVPLPPALAACLERPLRTELLAPSLEALRECLLAG